MGVERGPRRWILLRGLGREAEHWAPFLAEMKAVFPAAEVQTLDLPGAGAKYKERAPLQIGQYVDALHREADLKEPAGLVGLSLGAMVALAWADRQPESVSHLVTINTSVSTLSKPWERFTPVALAKGLLVLVRRAQRDRERAILELISNVPAKRESALEDWARIAESRPVAVATYFRQIRAALTCAPDFLRIRAPGLVLASRGDRLASYRCSEALAAKLNWPIALHSSAGHDLPLDDPKWCVWQINDWLTRTR